MKYTLESTFFSSSDRHSSHTLHIYAFQKVSNVEQIKQAIPDLDCAILNGDLVIFPPKQVFYAAIKALYVCKTKDIKRIIKSDKTDSEKKEFSNTYCMEEEVAAISRRRGEEMRTRSLYTELIYRLSPSTNVTDSLRQFGISQTAETILFAKIDEQESDKFEERLEKLVNGTRVHRWSADLEAIRKAFGTRQESVEEHELLEHCLTQAAIKSI